MRLSRLLALALAAASAPTLAQSLPEQIAAADAALFDALNQRDLAALAPFFSDRLEFFHDRGGLSGKEQTMRQFAEMFARPGVRIRREAIPGASEVYPLPGVGAMQVGRHRFCSSEDGAPEQCSDMGFSQVWEQTPDGWQLLRVLSYGH